MKTEYKYLEFTQFADTGKTTKWNCHNKSSGTILGKIKWHPAWRRYCYFPIIHAVYDITCLNDISDFLEQLWQKKKMKTLN